MIRRIRAGATFANVVSVLSLTFALGLGGAWAAVELGKDDVTSKHIKNETIKGKDLKPNAVSGDKVADGSLGAADFAAGQLPQGPPGEAGAPGADAVSLFAFIRDDGPAVTAVVQHGSGVVGVSDPNGHNAIVGSPYVVTFDRSLEGCVAHVTPGIGDPSGGSNTVNATIPIALIEDSTVRTAFTTHAGAADDNAFLLSVIC